MRGQFGGLDTSYYLCPMKNKQRKWLEVETLPDTAIKVSEYARMRRCNTSYIYKLAALKQDGIKTEQNTNFQIVEFHGINFIIP